MLQRVRIHILLLALVTALAACALAPSPAAAQAPGTAPAPATAAQDGDLPPGKTIPDTPAETRTAATPVAVVHGDVDQLGTRLAFRLKEIFNDSGLFALTSRDERKLKVVVTTRPEFPGRPQVGSVYAAVWIFSSGENVLTHYLACKAGTVDTTTVDATAEALAATTAAVAEQYAYLFE